MLSAIVLAAGRGKRLKSKVSKSLIKINAIPLIIYALKVLDKNKKIAEIVVVLNSKNQKQIKQALKKYKFQKIRALVLGGARRQDSVLNGLKHINPQTDWVLIHDAARPFITSKVVNNVILAAKKFGTAILGVRPKATIKQALRNDFVTQTLVRNKLWEVQTPQVFRKDLLFKAYKKYARSAVTDDAALIEKIGAPVKIVLGSYENIKITTNEDLLWAELIARKPDYVI